MSLEDSLMEELEYGKKKNQDKSSTLPKSEP